MARTLTKDEIFDLPVDERLRLMEALWDSIDPNELPFPNRIGEPSAKLSRIIGGTRTRVDRGMK